MAETKVVQISGVARPTPRMLMMARAIHGDRFARNVMAMVEDAKAVNALAGMIDRAIDKAVQPNGHIDLQLAAITMIQEMKANQR